MQLETITDQNTWNDTLRQFPKAHVLQTWEWGDFKQATTGWQPTRLLYRRDDGQVEAMASILKRRVGPLSVCYVPKGPILRSYEPTLVKAVLEILQRQARGAIWLKMDPDVVAATGVPGEEDDAPNLEGQIFQSMLRQHGWRFSADQPQFRNTITLDLTQSEDDILAAMSQNTRRKVRTAYKKGITVRPATLDDLPLMIDLYHATGDRDAFLVRPAAYYRHEWAFMMEAGLAHALIAEHEGTALAHVILFHFGSTCWYFIGASSNEERARMPNYALQWEAIKWAKAQGYATYDFWGAPDDFVETDRMWGVYEFKRGFRGTVVRHIGAWDYAPVPLLYTAYTQLWPRLQAWRRR